MYNKIVLENTVLVNNGVTCVFAGVFSTEEEKAKLLVATEMLYGIPVDGNVELPKDGQTYDLGACSGVYRASFDSFDIGNSFVHRSETIYADKR